jgi:protein pelota
LIISRFTPKKGICSFVVDSPDDLWILRRLISKGDTIITRSSRVMKRDEEYSRPDKGERVKLTLALSVETIALDRSVDRLRIRGKITEASDEGVNKSGTHSLSISPGHGLTLIKESWTQLHTRILNSTKERRRRFLIATIDRRGAGIGILSGSHLKILSTLDSGASGKRFKEESSQPFLKKILDILRNMWREGDMIIIAGPGHTKLTLANQISSDPDLSKNITVIEGFDLADADGVRNLIKFQGFQKVATDSGLIEVQGIVNEAIQRLSIGDPRVTYTFARVKDIADSGMIDSCVVSDDVFALGVEEEDVVSVLNNIEQRGGTVYLADSSLELGKQVSSLGGIIALLRYAIRAY